MEKDSDNPKEPHVHQAGPAVIREDRELLVELARLNRDLASLGMRIMDESASTIEQQDYAERLIAAGERLRRRAGEVNHPVIEGEVLENTSLVLPSLSLEPDEKL